jgi:hypothetical protein
MYSAIAPKVTEFFEKTDGMPSCRLVEPIDRSAQFFLRLVPEARSVLGILHEANCALTPPENYADGKPDTKRQKENPPHWPA